MITTTTNRRRYCNPTRQRRQLSPVETLRADIAVICEQIDRRLANPTGRAEKCIYAYYWPPRDINSVDTLTALHRDAADYLYQLLAGGGTPTAETWPSEAPQHPPRLRTRH